MDKTSGKPSVWTSTTIEEVARVIRGSSPRPKGDPRYYGGDVPRLMVQDVTRDGKHVTPSIDFLTNAGRLLSRPMPAGSLTVVCSGTVGVPSFLAIDACIHDGFLGIKDIKECCDVDFLYHKFMSLKNELDTSATHGGVFTNLTTEIVKKFEFVLPPLPEQRRIARILTTLDELIEKTEALIAKYQSLKQGMMHDLFTRGVDSHGRLRPTYQEAPQLYKESELGWIPKEWEEATFGDLAMYVNGNSFNAAHWKRTGLPIIRIQNLNGELDFNYYEGPVNPKWEVHTGDLLFAWSGMRETSFGPRIWSGRRGVLNQHIFKVTPNEAIVRKQFLNLSLRWHLDDIAKTAHGFKSSFVHVTRSEVTDVAVGLPPICEQDRIMARMVALENLMSSNHSMLSKLRTQKSGLMQDLLTGKVRVTVDEAEEIAANV